MKTKLMLIAVTLTAANQINAHCFSRDVQQDPTEQATCYKDTLSNLAKSDNDSVKEPAQGHLDKLAVCQKNRNTAEQNLKDTAVKLAALNDLLEKRKKDLEQTQKDIEDAKQEQANAQVTLQSKTAELGAACRDAGVWIKQTKYNHHWLEASGFVSKVVLFVKHHLPCF